MFCSFVQKWTKFRIFRSALIIVQDKNLHTFTRRQKETYTEKERKIRIQTKKKVERKKMERETQKEEGGECLNTERDRKIEKSKKGGEKTDKQTNGQRQTDRWTNRNTKREDSK